MKATKTIDTIRTFTVVGALTVVLTVLTQPPILTLPTRRSDIGLREAA